MERTQVWVTARTQAPLIAALVLSSALAVAMIAVRVVRADSTIYTFLVWNLFLAWVPLGFALLLWWVPQWPQRPHGLSIALLAGWLLFFPNAPYIVTDLIHLAARSGIPLWYDAMMLFIFAWNGLLLGFVSLWIVHQIVERRLGVAAGWLMVGGALLASGFGIYLGRFLRWNSWDVVTAPHSLLGDIVHLLTNPFAYQYALSVTVAFAGSLAVMYVTLALLLHTQMRFVNAAGSERVRENWEGGD